MEWSAAFVRPTSPAVPCVTKCHRDLNMMMAAMLCQVSNQASLFWSHTSSSDCLKSLDKFFSCLMLPPKLTSCLITKNNDRMTIGTSNLSPRLRLWTPQVEIALDAGAQVLWNSLLEGGKIPVRNSQIVKRLFNDVLWCFFGNLVWCQEMFCLLLSWAQAKNWDVDAVLGGFLHVHEKHAAFTMLRLQVVDYTETWPVSGRLPITARRIAKLC